MEMLTNVIRQWHLLSLQEVRSELEAAYCDLKPQSAVSPQISSTTQLDLTADNMPTISTVDIYERNYL